MAHEWGYRWTWPPLISELKPWQWQLMTLAQQTENYVTDQHQQAGATNGRQNGSLSGRYNGLSDEGLISQFQ